MTTILGAAASGMVNGQTVMDVVGNNVANVNSFAFKKTRALAEGTPDALATVDTMRMGVAQTTEDLVFSPSSAITTDDPLQFAINDDTFFRVQNTDGAPAYTRLGLLSIDSAGNVTVPGGLLLQPPITVPEGMSHVGIDANGQVTGLDSTGTSQVLGQVNLVRFMNPQGLSTLGGGLYAESVNSGAVSEGSPGSAGFARIRPGAVEGSNVDLAEEFTNMIMAQRAYQACAKTYSVGDQMLQVATNLTR